MKKVFFAFAVVAGLAMTACNNKPAETETVKTDSVVTTEAPAAAPATTDSVVKTDSVAAAPAATTTETKKVEEKKK